MPQLMYVGFAIWAVILGSSIYFARRFVRAFERRSESQAALTALEQRLAELEDAMESVRDDLGRLEAGQEFTTRLLGSRSGLVKRPEIADGSTPDARTPKR
jgi:membrane protein implicated in regulation of membrane protease activity